MLSIGTIRKLILIAIPVALLIIISVVIILGKYTRLFEDLMREDYSLITASSDGTTIVFSSFKNKEGTELREYIDTYYFDQRTKEVTPLDDILDDIILGVHEYDIEDISISANGRYIAIAEYNHGSQGSTSGLKSLCVYDVISGELPSCLDVPNVEQDVCPPDYIYHCFQNYTIYDYVLSDSGRFLVFSTTMDFFVPNDTNKSTDVFLVDFEKETLQLVSADNEGRPTGGTRPDISADGRTISFVHDGEIYIRDMLSNTVRKVAPFSIRPLSDPGSPQLSGDGRFLAFWGNAESSEQFADIYVANIETGETRSVVTSAYSNSFNSGRDQLYGPQDPRWHLDLSISEDGMLIAFWSASDKLVEEDRNDRADVFVFDQRTSATTRVSTDGNGNEGNDYSWNPTITADGKMVVFASRAGNLVYEDDETCTEGINGEWHNYNCTDIFMKNLATGEVTMVSGKEDEG